MANQWLRLWHDMPNDPKWRTIARVSKQSIPAVMAVYIHLLVIASNANERGRTQSVCSEDIASALDLDVEQIDAILEAMQGRVLDGDMISGWSKRQVDREDGSAERAKRWREAKKGEKQTQPNATERKQTPDKDKDKESKPLVIASANDIVGMSKKRNETDERFSEFWKHYPRKVAKADAEKAWKAARINGEFQSVIDAIEQQKQSDQWTKDGGQFIPYAATWIRKKRWADELSPQLPAMSLYGGAL